VGPDQLLEAGCITPAQADDQVALAAHSENLPSLGTGPRELKAGDASTGTAYGGK
jgi:hypothetical protein